MCHRKREDPLLQIDDDEGGVRVEFREWHEVSFKSWVAAAWRGVQDLTARGGRRAIGRRRTAGGQGSPRASSPREDLLEQHGRLKELPLLGLVEAIGDRVAQPRLARAPSRQELLFAPIGQRRVPPPRVVGVSGTALGWHPGKLTPRERLSVVQADLFDPSSLASGLAGHDAVIRRKVER
jgi:hypothetical protein